MKLNLPFHRINWITSAYLIGTAIIAMTASPFYIWRHGLDWFQVSLFLFYFMATGFSITLGYHRLFTHLAFNARWPVKLFTLIFGAAAFQNSVLEWSSDHRRHHKHVDEEDDPYDITKGFFHAHVGWLLFKFYPEPPMDNVKDLERDPLVMWQHRWCHVIGGGAGFVMPAVLGWLYGGPQAALGAFLIAGVLRVVFVQHMTFCINSFCHYIGRRPYSSRCTARDSWLMAFFTFGEGYHNYHHEFQHDYRNGVKPWQFDPTKWIIWLLNKVGLAKNLRRVPYEKILLAEFTEAMALIEARLESPSMNLSDSTRELLQSCQAYLQETSQKLSERYKELQRVASEKNREFQHAAKEKLDLSREMMAEWRRELKAAKARLQIIRRLELSIPSASNTV